MILAWRLNIGLALASSIFGSAFAAPTDQFDLVCNDPSSSRPVTYSIDLNKMVWVNGQAAVRKALPIKHVDETEILMIDDFGVARETVRIDRSAGSFSAQLTSNSDGRTISNSAGSCKKSGFTTIPEKAF